MLEIVAIVMLCSAVGKMAREKGRTAIGYQFMTVGFWFGGEIFGAIVGAVLDLVLHGEAAQGFSLFAYLFALGGAAVGAVVAYLIVKSLPPVN